jgi:hypothetical protein
MTDAERVAEWEHLLSERNQYRRDFEAMSERAAELAERITEVERERDEARIALAILQNAAQFEPPAGWMEAVEAQTTKVVTDDDIDFILIREGLTDQWLAVHRPTGLAAVANRDHGSGVAIAKLRTALAEVVTVWRDR